MQKWRKLTDTRRNLQTFSLVTDGLGATVFLRNASGKEFKTFNTPVVSAVMEEIKSTLDERIKEVETQIKSEDGEAFASPSFLVVNSH